MTEHYAAWAAANALPLFIVLPLLCASAAVLAVRGLQAMPRRGRALCVALGVCASLILFLLLAIAVKHEGAMVAFDKALARDLSMSMSVSMLWLLSWFTYLGDRAFLTGLSVLMVLALLWHRRWGLAVFCGVTTGVGGALNWLMKHSFERVRPDHDHGYVTVTGWSFPSGHSSAAMAVYGAAGYLLWRLAPPAWRRPGIAVLAALIAAVGLSRVLLQVHFVSDVLAGFAVTLGWLVICVAVEQRLRASGDGRQYLQ